MSDCKNPSCEEKDLHPVTVRSHEGCCGPLCEEVMDHEKTLVDNEKLKARVAELEHICNEKNKILDYLHEEGDKLRARIKELEGKSVIQEAMARAFLSDLGYPSTSRPDFSKVRTRLTEVLKQEKKAKELG